MPGIDPKVWGPSAWWLLHTAAAKAAASSTSSHDLAMFKKMTSVLDCLLPCETCRENFKAHLARYRWPRTASALPGWVYKLHNSVNEKASSNAPPKRAPILAIYAQSCNVSAKHEDLVAKAAPFLAFIEPDCAALRDFAEGLHYFFQTPVVTEQSVKNNKGFKKWLGITALHVKNCKGTCSQKGGCA